MNCKSEYQCESLRCQCGRSLNVLSCSLATVTRNIYTPPLHRHRPIPEPAIVLAPGKRIRPAAGNLNPQYTTSLPPQLPSLPFPRDPLPPVIPLSRPYCARPRTKTEGAVLFARRGEARRGEARRETKEIESQRDRGVGCHNNTYVVMWAQEGAVCCCAMYIAVGTTLVCWGSGCACACYIWMGVYSMGKGVGVTTSVVTHLWSGMDVSAVRSDTNPPLTCFPSVGKLSGRPRNARRSHWPDSVD